MDLISLHSAHWSKPFMLAMNERTTQDALKDIPPDKRSTTKISYTPPKPYPAPKRDDPLPPSIAKISDGFVITLPPCVFPAYRADGKPSHVRAVMPNHVIAR